MPLGAALPPGARRCDECDRRGAGALGRLLADRRVLLQEADGYAAGAADGRGAAGTRARAQPAATAAPPPRRSQPPRPGKPFRDCPDCPEMVAVPGRQFQHGFAAKATRRSPGGTKARTIEVTIAAALRPDDQRSHPRPLRRLRRGDRARHRAAAVIKPMAAKGKWDDERRLHGKPGFEQQGGRHPVVCVELTATPTGLCGLAEPARPASSYRLPSEAGVGICGPRRDDAPSWPSRGATMSPRTARLQCRQRPRRQRPQGQISAQRSRRHAMTGSSQTAPVGMRSGECLRPLRHARQCLGMGRGLLSPDL